jgi:hypothetical protein
MLRRAFEDYTKDGEGMAVTAVAHRHVGGLMLAWPSARITEPGSRGSEGFTPFAGAGLKATNIAAKGEPSNYRALFT